MPRSIKLFVWLSLAYVVWTSFWNFEFLVWPSAHYAQVHGKLTAYDRSLSEQGELYAALVRTVCFVLSFVVFAVLVGFRRGWARWGVLLTLVAQETILLIVVGYFYVIQPDSFRFSLPLVQAWQQSYHFDAAHWVHWTSLAQRVLLVTLLFLPDARRWFRKTGL